MPWLLRSTVTFSVSQSTGNIRAIPSAYSLVTYRINGYLMQACSARIAEKQFVSRCKVNMRANICSTLSLVECRCNSISIVHNDSKR